MRVTTIAVVVAVIASNGPAHAEPFRLRADALGQAGAPTGVVSLSAEADPTRWAEAEALIWAGTNESDSEMDVLVVAISIRDPERGHQARLGRMIASLGALRPVHLDGVSGHLRMSSGTVFEAFGGIPVKPRFGRPDYDWLAGARVAQSITRFGTAGVAYLHRRDAGRLSDQEVGADFSLTPHEALGLSGRITYDLVNPGVSEAIGFIAFRASRAWRFEVRGTHRSPSRILPATSLFSVLGDVPSRYVGGRARWQAAPRLDLIAEGGLRAFDSLVAEDGRLRGVLRLDPPRPKLRIARSITAELRRRWGLDRRPRGARPRSPPRLAHRRRT